ncbi:MULTISPECIES: hypothetical protein [unclassified Haladaptatus]|uniref:hypothetical protein n=1 Tax=unclassified Haladaptatus TaxID=2622732 RepID=UPI002FCE0D94
MDITTRRSVLAGLGLAIGSNTVGKLPLVLQAGASENLLIKNIEFVKLEMRADDKAYQGRLLSTCTDFPQVQPLHGNVEDSQTLVISSYDSASQQLQHADVVLETTTGIEAVSRNKVIRNLPVLPLNPAYHTQLDEIDAPPVSIKYAGADIELSVDGDTKRIPAGESAQTTRTDLGVEAHVRNYGQKTILAHPSQTLFPKTPTSIKSLDIMKKNFTDESVSTSVTGSATHRSLEITEYPDQNVYGIQVVNGGK